MDTDTLAMAQEIDFSLLGLFARATITVKLVMIGLIVMSFWSWAIIVQRHILFRAARREAEVFDRAFWSGEPLDELFEKIGPAPEGASEKIFAAGMAAIRPMPVASSASAMPGATVARSVFFVAAICVNACMIPNTVPKSPMNGAVEPVVARYPMPLPSRSPSRAIATSIARSIRACAPAISPPSCR